MSDSIKIDLDPIGVEGHISIPDPLMLDHLREWWGIVMEGLKQGEFSRLQNAFWDLELEGAMKLVLDYGEWAVPSIKVGDARNGKLPAKVAEFVRSQVTDYVAKNLDPKRAALIHSVL